MRIFAIRDEFDTNNKNLAYLFYYENEKRFYIELPDDVDEWEAPLILSSFLKKGQRTINSYWSKVWVQERIVPPDRQNLGQILRANGLDEYDEFKLLLLADGRCAQDDYYLVPLFEEDLPKEFVERYQKKIEDVVPLQAGNVLVFFRDGTTKKVNVADLVKTDPHFFSLLRKEELFDKVNVQTGGYGISWGEQLDISDDKLYESGIDIPLIMEDLRSFIRNRVVDTSEVAIFLDCSRQNVNDLVNRGKLTPVKKDSKNTLFLKSEVMRRKWK